MKKTIIAVIVLAVAFMLVMSSCSSGISKEQYDKALKDLDAAQAQVLSLQTQSQTLKDQNQTLQNQSQALQKQVQELQTKVQSLQSQPQPSAGDGAKLLELQHKINQTKPYWALFTSFYQIAVTGQTPSMVQLGDLMGKVQALNDATLNSKMQAIVASGLGKKESMELADYLITRIDEVLK